MKLPQTMSRYLASTYLRNMLFMLGLLLGVIYLFDTVELLRRASKRDGVPLSLVLEMGLLKLPKTGQIILPFAILFSAMFTFWKLTQRHELVVVRAAGFSVWQFLAPVIGVAVMASAVNLTLVNPAGSVLLSRYETLENDYLSDKKSYVALLREGLWLRQMQDQGHVILHAGGIDLTDWTLKNVMALYFDTEDNFLRRIDSRTAHLKEGAWQFEDAVSNTPSGAGEKIPLVVLPTDLTVKEIEESFGSPETLSFWALPGFIKTLETTGFDATRLKIHFQTLLSQPLLFAAMVLLAACVSLRPPRFRGAFLMTAGGVMIGFVVFFLSSFLEALGASHQMPAFLAAWSPALITFLIGISVMMNLEDG